jgi:hypothetical protein
MVDIESGVNIAVGSQGGSATLPRVTNNSGSTPGRQRITRLSQGSFKQCCAGRLSEVAVADRKSWESR